MKKYLPEIRRSNIVIFLLLMLVYMGNVMFIQQHHSVSLPVEMMQGEKKFAGSSSCASCHKEIFQQHIKTAHYIDSRPASKEFIKGSFQTGKNRYVYNKFLEVAMEKKKDRFFQTAYVSGEVSQSEAFDIVIGSGRKGQTYLYWVDDKLFQLPISYYTPTDSWVNSPGFATNFIHFDRQIPAQCLECHGTYAKAEDNLDNLSTFDRNQIIYGVDCERCHGPAADHVSFHSSHPNEKATYIINPKHLSRQQRLDGCALCHSGFRTGKKPAFSFMVGDKLDDFSSANYSPDSVEVLDVHGNQYGLLSASKCFKMSAEMDCSSCHNPHKNEFNSPKIFSQKCMSCHTDAKHNTCTLPLKKGLILSDNCVDCHMPSLASSKILLELSNSGKAIPDEVRTHRIAVYEQKSRDFLEKKGLSPK